MPIDISEEQLALESADLLKILLKDRTTKKNIVWATHSYELLGKGFAPSDRITPSRVTGTYASLIQPRSEKSKYEQKDRTKIRAEVFTPTWLVEKQNAYVEAELEDLALEDYIQVRWLEITCGEAPYMVTRYDTVTGEEIPLSERVGFVDRKLQRISREVSDEATFYELVKKAYRASYGYEYQGDSLLLARENLLATFEDYYLAKTGTQPTIEQKKEIATIISYNVFQMDGLKKISPYSAKQNPSQQLSLFSDELEVQEVEESKTQIKDWKKNKMIGFERLSSEESEMKFDVVIGNPPYQEEAQGTSTKDMPIYHKFISESYKISKKASLITPARFLSNAGGTPKTWNQQMLNNQHVKVSFFEQKSGNVFPGTDIKGGVAVTYYDAEREFEPIEVFVPFIEMNSIRKKVIKKNFESIDQFVTNRGSYRYSDLIYTDFPKLMSRVSDRRVASNAFEKLPELFFDIKPEDGNEYIKIYGRFNNERVYKWFRKDYVTCPSNFEKYKIILPKANGSGAIGEVLSTPVIGYPVIGYTETFISVGEFDSLEEAEACLKYIKSKFLRTMLGILKITQDNTKAVWHYIPLQDFTVNSDIDWTQSVADIDRQLYQKYDLSPEEIAFIETHVREMD
ncbi:Eco57I restriction-modification methylase domain-containing protein [Streptococcus sp. 210928-DFI.4.42]|uniref:Eco57I restriction-modification methylase domain-containing protein n=1 Tax=Streptococcus sp. 210928-DFI.4.42 TaxID=2883234 RepID=UPI001D07BB24|nr:Eco57I restriction-modification methylase domain-containing protein [Streptococcus sp. 210928-DFI.4.42]MCB7060794.1 Eco57I restriction-modification methylase domain-containing protein [Streptococcus sp. 210928-DFI.4.42]